MRRAIVAAAVVAAAAGAALGAAGGVAPAVTLSPASPRQGDPVVVRCDVPGGADNAAIEWKGLEIPMREEARGRYAGLIGIDLADPPGAMRVAVSAERGGVRTTREARLTVVERPFPVQRLSLPRSQAVFDNATLARIEAERRVLDERLARLSRPLLWELPLVPPVENWRPRGFGARRVINGEPRSPHAGVDVTVPEGTPVRAVAAGTVVFAGEQFFGGRSVVLDHGGGLVSLYYHLREYTVAEGQRVGRGETIGAVGTTGRSAGAHLHFGLRAAGGRVDPATLLERVEPGEGTR